MRRVLRALFRPFFMVLIRLVPVEDQWERIDVTVPLRQYGSGARLDFAQYLNGASIVSVSTFAGIREWLTHCEYLSDQALFNESDFWQHPSTFERLRAGDCEDFAVWAWRKMLELGMDVDLVSGYCVENGELSGRHAWVVFRDDGKSYLFEPTRGVDESAVRQLDDVKGEYIPEFGVDRHATRFAYGGYFTVQKKLGANSRAKELSS